MTKPFDTWQVFPHRPLEKLESNLWRVEGDLPGTKSTRVMTIAKRRDGGLVIHNAVALEEELMREIESFGKPSVLVVPNGFHRLDARIFKNRYPDLRVVCPAHWKKKVSEIVAVDGSYSDVAGDDSVSLRHFAGTKDKEGWLEVKSETGTTVVVNDVMNNLPKMGGFFGFVLAPTGIPSVPRLAHWLMISDKPAFRSNLEQIGAIPDLKRVIVSHGAPITDQPSAVMKTVAAAV